MLKTQLGTVAASRSRKLLKTAMGGDSHRGFESHALRFVQRKMASDQDLSWSGAVRMSLSCRRLRAVCGGPMRLAVRNTC